MLPGRWPSPKAQGDRRVPGGGSSRPRLSEKAAPRLASSVQSEKESVTVGGQVGEGLALAALPLAVAHVEADLDGAGHPLVSERRHLHHQRVLRREADGHGQRSGEQSGARRGVFLRGGAAPGGRPVNGHTRVQLACRSRVGLQGGGSWMDGAGRGSEGRVPGKQAGAPPEKPPTPCREKPARTQRVDQLRSHRPPSASVGPPPAPLGPLETPPTHPTR